MSDLTKHLVRIDKFSDQYHPGVVFGGARRESFGVPTEKCNADDTNPSHFQFYEVAETDLDAAIHDLTKRHPGVEVVVYAPVKCGVRPAGELVSKNISKNGVLP